MANEDRVKNKEQKDPKKDSYKTNVDSKRHPEEEAIQAQDRPRNSEKKTSSRGK